MKFSDFGFKENPFAITPNPRYFFLSRGHEESLAHLIYGTGPNGGFVLLTGEVGTGKTLLLRSLLEQKLEDVDVALVLNPRLSRREFLATICDELGVEYKGPPYSLKHLSDVLAKKLLETHSKGKHTVLVVDEAQNLSPRVLEQVRLLTNLETSQHKLLRIILVGQPELVQMLARKELRQVDQRITARYHLLPLNIDETRAYVTHRLAVAGVREDLFTSLAIRLLHYFSGGVPRLINIICERTLLAIYTTGKQRVTAHFLWQAVREVKGVKYKQHKYLGIIIGLGLVLVLVVGGWFWFDQSQSVGSNDRLTPVQQKPEITHQSVAEEKKETKPVSPASTVSKSMKKEPEPVSADKKAPPLNKPPAAIPSESTSSSQQSSEQATPEEINLQRLFSQPQNSVAIYQLLFQQWDSSVSLKKSEPPCQQASNYGLRCLQDSASWESLMRLNRPFLISLEQEGKKRLLVLTHVDNDWLLVHTGEEQGLLRFEHLKPYWKGDFVMLWRPATEVTLIGNGSTGEAVTWLRQRLHLADGKPLLTVAGIDRFDSTVKARLKEFQRHQGLLDDGIAGQQTQIHLNNLTLPKGTPTLISSPGQGEN
jgi:general secretion pathway protein A